MRQYRAGRQPVHCTDCPSHTKICKTHAAFAQPMARLFIATLYPMRILLLWSDLRARVRSRLGKQTCLNSARGHRRLIRFSERREILMICQRLVVEVVAARPRLWLAVLCPLPMGAIWVVHSATPLIFAMWWG